MAQKNLTTKTLESYNDVFADIMNVILFDGRQTVLSEELKPAEKDSRFKADGKIRGQDRDVAKFWKNANINIAFVGIENQVAVEEFMPLRIFSYDGAEYKKQYDLHKNGKLKKCYPVITLVIYFGSENWNHGKNLCSCFDVPEELSEFVNDYNMNFYAVKDFTDTEIEKFTSDFRVIAEFFSALLNKKDYKPTNKKLDHPDEVIDMISIFSGDGRFRDEYNSMTEKGEVNMCEIYDKIQQEGIEKGIEKGRAEGREEGRAEGREEGRKEGKAEAIKQLIKKGLSKANIIDLFDLTTDETKLYFGDIQTV